MGARDEDPVTGSVLAMALAVASPKLAAQAGVCREGTCADGYTGCGCDVSCCERRLRGANGGSGYTPEMAALMSLSNALGSALGRAMRGDDREAQRRGQEELQSRIAAQHEAERRQQEFALRRSQLASEMVAAPPTGRFDFLEDTIRARPNPYQPCKRGFPSASADELGDSASSRRFLQRLAEWETICGRRGYSGAIARATTVTVGLALALDSRAHELALLPDPRDPAWRRELRGMDDDLDHLRGRMTAAEKKEFSAYASGRLQPPPYNADRRRLVALDVPSNGPKGREGWLDRASRKAKELGEWLERLGPRTVEYVTGESSDAGTSAPWEERQ